VRRCHSSAHDSSTGVSLTVGRAIQPVTCSWRVRWIKLAGPYSVRSGPERETTAGRPVPPLRWESRAEIESLSTEEWNAAHAAHERLHAETSAACQRFAKVQDEIALRCEAGELKTAIRYVCGGKMEPVPAHWWNTETIRGRFTNCQIDQEDPYGHGEFTLPAWCWIYLTRDSIDRFVNSLTRSARPAVVAPGSAAEKKCRGWLIDIMRDSPDEPILTKERALAQAKGKFSGLSNRAFNRAWIYAVENANAQAWSAPGARRKSPR
jgi:hypothetical protein